MTTKANRVVVTGMGCVSPLGCDPETLFAKAMAGSTHFVHAPEADKTSLLSLVDGVAFRQQCCAYGLTDEASFTGYTSLALAMALHEARLIGESDMLSRAPLYIGTSNIHTDCEQHLYTDVRDVAQRHGIGGSIVLLPVACTGGNVAIALGANMIRSGRTDVAVVGGVDVYTPTAYAIFSSLGILSQRTSVPAGARVGIVNAYNRVNIDPLLDFEDEMARYGWALVDPQKSAFTISNACAGWLAMQLHLPYLNLTVDGGQESLSEAVAIAEASMRLGQIDYCLVIDGGYCEGHAVLALLLSPQPTTHTLFEMTPHKQGLQIKKVEP